MTGYVVGFACAVVIALVLQHFGVNDWLYVCNWRTQ
jgi:hypothetical protein